MKSTVFFFVVKNYEFFARTYDEKKNNPGSMTPPGSESFIKESALLCSCFSLLLILLLELIGYGLWNTAVLRNLHRELCLTLCE